MMTAGLSGWSAAYFAAYTTVKLRPFGRAEGRAHHSSADTNEVGRRHREHMPRGAGGGPHDLVLQQGAVDERTQASRMAERRDPADREPGGSTDPAGVGPLDDPTGGAGSLEWSVANVPPVIGVSTPPGQMQFASTPRRPRLKGAL